MWKYICRSTCQGLFVQHVLSKNMLTMSLQGQHMFYIMINKRWGIKIKLILFMFRTRKYILINTAARFKTIIRSLYNLMAFVT